MKAVKLIIGIVLVLSFFISCSSDDNNSNNPSNTFMDRLTNGIWYLQDETQATVNNCKRNTTYDFKRDNTLEVQAYFQNSQGVCQNQAEGSFTYEINSENNQLTTTQLPDGPTTIYDNIQLTDDEFVIEGDYNGLINTITFDRTAG